MIAIGYFLCGIAFMVGSVLDAFIWHDMPVLGCVLFFIIGLMLVFLIAPMRVVISRGYNANKNSKGR